LTFELKIGQPIGFAPKNVHTILSFVFFPFLS